MSGGVGAKRCLSTSSALSLLGVKGGDEFVESEGVKEEE